jgi:hypothetical protein
MSDEGDSPAVEPFIKTYSLEEVSAMVLPPDLKDGPGWLLRRLRSGNVGGYKVGRTWRMTRADVEDLIASHRNPQARPAPEPYSDGLSLTPTSRRRVRRIQ